jgi:3-hydroxyanthranilate 3,4-dioxygenase
LRWYCPDDIHLVHQAEFRLQHIDEDLHRVMNDFWNGPVERRTCKETGKVIERAGTFAINEATNH